MKQRATGTFTVAMAPQAPHDPSQPAPIGRMLLDKRYAGDLEASAAGEMLAARTAVAGSAAYVALERVDGTLHGRAGGFVLQHTGSMDRGRPSLAVVVVPDSGTGALTGLAGTLAIEIVDGEHRYTLDYALHPVEPPPS